MSDNAPTHSMLSPSKAEQWTTCTASVRFIRDNKDRLPPDKPTPAAMEGTKAHHVAEALILKEDIPVYATKDMLLHARGYAEFCNGVMLGSKVFSHGVEKRVPLYYLPQERGTVDFFAHTSSGLHLVDFKYGYGEVESVGNKQMAIYAASMIREWQQSDAMWGCKPRVSGDTKVTMTIYQPRLTTEMVTWEITVKELLAFVDKEITPHARAILAGEPGVFKASEKACKFCPAKGMCKAYNDHLLGDFDTEVLDAPPKVESMSEEYILRMYALRDNLAEWIDSIEKYVNAKVLSGKPMPGLKVTLSNGGHRYWRDPTRASKVLMELGLAYDEVFPPSDVISPAQAEKLTKKKKTGKLIQELFGLMVKPPGSPIVVPLSDPRPEYKRDPAADFAELEENDFWS